MAESYSVKATLSAQDKNFSSVMSGALMSMNNLKSTVTSGIGFGVLTGIGQQAFSTLSNGAVGLVGELGSSSAAWKTFTSNMEMNGKTGGEIKSIKKELQSFAEQTIYSSSDMAGTFSQLEAVGTKNTSKLVKGFGGLAAAAENPQQAMKTLSQQATQMASKPTVAWMDFKLMLEQTPAGISAVAKEMGMSTTDLVKNVQSGTIATEDFFDAISKVGTNEGFTKLATEYKTVGQAMDGLKETAANKLQPAFESLSSVAISGISGIVDSLGSVDATGIATSITSTIDKIRPYWDVFKEDAITVKDAFGDAFSAIGSSLGELTGAFGSTESIENFSDVIGVAKDALVGFAGFMEEHSDVIAKVLTKLPALLVAYQGFKLVSAVAPGIKMFTSALTGLAGKGISAIAGKLFGISNGQEAVGKSSGQSSKKILTSAKAFMTLGAGVAMVSAGFALLAYSAISLAQAGPVAIGVMTGLVVAVAAFGAGMVVMLNSIKPGPAKLKAISIAMLAMGVSVVLVAAGFAILTASAINLASAGPLAIAVMIGLVAAIAGLALGASIIGPALTAGAVGFIAFGAAIALVGLGALLAAAALTLIVGVLPTVVQYGASGAVAIAQLSLGMLAFAAGAALAGVGCIALGAGLVVVAAGLVLVGAAVIVTAVGVLALAAGAVVLGAGMTLTATALMMTAAVLPSVASGALAGTVAFTAMLAVSVALAASMTVLSVPLLLVSVTFLTASVSAAAFALAMTTGAVGVLAMSVALKAVNSSMKSIASNAKMASSSIASMVSSIDIVNAGLDALGSKAKSAVDKMISVFSGSQGDAQSAATTMMNGYNSGVKSGGILAIATSNTISIGVVSALGSAESGAYNCGYNIGIGLANGMQATLGMVMAVAAQLASAADAAIRAKAKIHSPSRVSEADGQYWGIGLANGIISTKRLVEKYSKRLISIPSDISKHSEMSIGYRSHAAQSRLDSNYTYNPVVYVNAEVNSIMDGKKVGYGSAQYVEEKNQREAQIKKSINGYR